MQTQYKHLVVDFYGCSFNTPANNTLIKEHVFSILSKVGLILSEHLVCKRCSDGLSITIFMSTGHIVLHTSPNLKYVALDIFTCDEENTPEKIIPLLKAYFKPEKTKITHIRRGGFNNQPDMKPRIKISIAPLRRVKNTGARVLKLFSKKKQ